ncbi:LLM class flavin-dependent oxidoreductase [Nonomuraea basaltis]|uniref:LLM class flavin-dependent oxidoreductase n=1 Tax=Nonomuraea basaltis TaxID=2495887 RepID=UPI00110C5C88|nr:LLM class flavin-dependent oxidoreductase [Nonomuraea basaltis]TMR98322.1 LLM class flavin-dependent oxidoreductase [Nonomuraea basaltis]
MDTRLGVLLPTNQSQWSDARGLVDFGIQAERLGYDSVWVNDTLLGARIEPLAMLSALAPVTRRVVLGTAALLPAFRRPVTSAQELASIDHLSAGRLVVTVGAGFPGRSEIEYALSEVPWRRRFARLDDTVALWRALWAGERAFQGEELRFGELPESTPCYRPGGPPIWLAGATPSALERTGRLYDGWLPYPPDAADYRAGLASIRHAAGSAGRPSGAITPALFITVLVTEDVDRGERQLDAYCRDTYGLPSQRVRKIQAIVTGSAERVAAALARYAEAGAEHIVCRIAAPTLEAQLDQLQLIAGILIRPSSRMPAT